MMVFKNEYQWDLKLTNCIKKYDRPTMICISNKDRYKKLDLCEGFEKLFI